MKRVFGGLDSSPLSVLTHPHNKQAREACQAWVRDLSLQGVGVLLPEIVDYELRRDYLRRSNQISLRLLDELAQRVIYLPITTAVLRRAAQIWAQLHQTGQTSGHPKSLDADCILIAQMPLEAESFSLQLEEWIIATSDVTDISRLAPAANWAEIRA